MQKCLSPQHDKLFDIAWYMLPKEVRQELESYIWKVKSVNNLHKYTVHFDDKSQVTNLDPSGSWGWCPPNKTYTQVAVILPEKLLDLAKEQEEISVYYILHELGHAVECMALREKDAAFIAEYDINDSESFACKQAEEWALEESKREGGYIYAAAVANIAHYDGKRFISRSKLK